MENIPQITKLVQVGIRDYCLEEVEYIQANKDRISVFFDRDIKNEIYEGGTWGKITDRIIAELPQNVFLSFDIDALDPQYCPATGTPVMGGFEPEQVFYLIEKVLKSGRKLIGFDLVETGVGETEWDANVSARVLFKLCNFLAGSNLRK
jgi:agmatinase